jgi:hypothetical protein
MSVGFLLAVVALILLNPDTRPTRIGPTSVVASVNGQKIRVDDIQALLRPRAPRTGPKVPPDPVRIALARAIDKKLLAIEAKREGLQVPITDPSVAETALAKEYIVATLDDHNLNPSAIPDRQAKAYYQRHSETFDRVHRVYVSAIVVSEKLLAEKLLDNAQGSSKAEFAALIRRYSADESPRSRDGRYAVVHEDGEGASAAIARTALWMREKGRIGLARDLDGNYVVLRVDRLEVTRVQWGPRLAARVKNVIAHRKTQRSVRELAHRLRRAASITINSGVLREIEVPTWADYASLY